MDKCPACPGRKITYTDGGTTAFGRPLPADTTVRVWKCERCGRTEYIYVRAKQAPHEDPPTGAFALARRSRTPCSA